MQVGLSDLPKQFSLAMHYKKHGWPLGSFKNNAKKELDKNVQMTIDAIQDKMTCEQIAEKIGVSRNTTYRRLLRAFKSGQVDRTETKPCLWWRI